MAVQAALAFLLLAAPLFAATATVKGPAAGHGGVGFDVTLAAQRIGDYFASPRPEAAKLGDFIPAFLGLDLDDPGIREQLAPVSEQLRAAGAALFKAEAGERTLEARPGPEASGRAEKTAALEFVFARLLDAELRERVRQESRRQFVDEPALYKARISAMAEAARAREASIRSALADSEEEPLAHLQTSPGAGRLVPYLLASDLGPRRDSLTVAPPRTISGIPAAQNGTDHLGSFRIAMHFFLDTSRVEEIYRHVHGERVLNIGLSTSVDFFSPAILTRENLVTDLRRRGIDAMGLDPMVEDDPESGYISGRVEDIPLPDDSIDRAVSVGLFDPSYILKITGGAPFRKAWEFYVRAAAELRRVLRHLGIFQLQSYHRNEHFLEALKSKGFETNTVHLGSSMQMQMLRNIKSGSTLGEKAVLRPGSRLILEP